MYDLVLDPSEELIQIEDEPALEIALPQVFTQPPLTTLQREKLPHVERLIAQLYRIQTASPGPSGLGPGYQELIHEFQPLFTWATACWDFLLSTEGCRFVLRNGEDTFYTRGDYRAVTDKDYSRLVHRIFRQCVMDFASHPVDQSFAAFLRTHFWEAVLQTYRKLEDPPDPRQRKLTGYSYLRCIPYRFLNAFHQDLVDRTLQMLPRGEQDALTGYFLQFQSTAATAAAVGMSAEDTTATLRHSLITLLIHHRLVYCLLRQIERY